jgi:hypothetical protein
MVLYAIVRTMRVDKIAQEIAVSAVVQISIFPMNQLIDIESCGRTEA